MSLTIKQEAFSVAIAGGMLLTAAYRSAYDCTKMKDATANNEASKLLRHPRIAARVQELKNSVAELAVFDRAAVLNQLMHMAFGDRNELVEYQRNNCRYCNGVKHKYQWRDQDEFAEAFAAAVDHNGRYENTPANKPYLQKMPEDKGGYGFRHNAAPSDDCPRCNGDGIERAHFKDTRKLPAGAKAIYEGVELTKEGVKFKITERKWAVDILAKHFGVVGPDAPSVTVNVNAAPGTKVPDELILPLDQQSASKIYQKMMQGGGDFKKGKRK